MLSITDLQPGLTVLWHGQPCQIIASSHKQLGRGRGIQNIRLKNWRDGTIIDVALKGNARVEQASVTKRQAQFLYRDLKKLIFMDPQSFEQIELDQAKIEQTNLLKEGELYDLIEINGEPLTVTLPIKIIRQVSATEPGLRGDRQIAGTKPATLENGAVIQVPLFIKPGDQVVIDTRTKSYVERAK